MITYEPFWEELKAKSITTYALINDYGISASLIDRLKHNRPISTKTLDRLCNKFNLFPNDIIDFKFDSWRK